MKKIDLLLSLYIACIVASELLGSKTFTLWGLTASVAIFTFPLTFTINDVVTEVFGKERAVSFVKSGLVILIFLALFTGLALVVPPSTRFVPTNTAYNAVFGKSLRIILASLTAFWLSERLDVFVFSRIREKLGQKKLWLRTNVSNFVSQFFDTALFMFLAFYQLGNFWFVLSLIGPYWLMKCLFSIIETPFAYFGVKWLKNGDDC